MALRNALLAALIDRESSGYDLAKRFSVSVANFWTATPQQLYRELEKMEAEGLLSARMIKQDRRPDKRLFSVTEAGRAALFAFTQQDPKPTTVRDELLVQVEALTYADVPSVRKSIERRIEQSEQRVAAYERSLAEILGSRSPEEFLATGHRIGPYLTLQRGISFERDNITWGRAALEILARRFPD
ncbi:PadR family transcriptional regulator [Actinoplanes ianthinogenes]|uniref:PadR family transcriptional regulator n=1 Tax=Actinoplanes ianthinogenes TaxID=122358 RepID=A0ABM7LJC7_9ACTN|nr:PadR family transcriptional regulator [Actinoplanes ianthinogenes]BCJ39358.1 PadR family transcriptional regulator [Actinoplanes ianthinogenes]GGR36658.1 PadR family transcriptional regulator [Actinoplanes ianthinogenes]